MIVSNQKKIKKKKSFVLLTSHHLFVNNKPGLEGGPECGRWVGM